MQICGCTVELEWAACEQCGGTVSAAHDGESFSIPPNLPAGSSLVDTELEQWFPKQRVVTHKGNQRKAIPPFPTVDAFVHQCKWCIFPACSGLSPQKEACICSNFKVFPYV